MLFTNYIECAAIYNDDADDNNDAGDDLKNQNTLLLQLQKQQYEGRTSRHYFLAIAVAAVVINGWFSFRTHRCFFSLAMLLSLSDEHLMLLFLVSASRPALSRPAPHRLLPVLRDLRLLGAAGFFLHWCCFCRDVVGNV